jgi:twinfilin-like protein
MARANLVVTQEIINAFLAAQDSRNVRVLRVRIVGEEMVLDATLEREGTAQSDFDNLLHNSLTATEACFAIYCLTDDSSGPLSWCLIAWVPDGCRVRDKMLYSSSREDIKFSLGLGYFKSEYGASEFNEITWDSYQNSFKRDFDPDILTETERLVLEEKVLTQQESGDVKSSALVAIPFELSPEVSDKLHEFLADQCNWLDVTVNNEIVQLLGSKTLQANEELKPHINPDVARYNYNSFNFIIVVNILCSFIIAKFHKADGTPFSIFVFSCPENVPVRMKMTMSSSKVEHCRHFIYDFSSELLL